MTSYRISMLFIFSILLISSTYTPITVVAENTVIPTQESGILVDGNITNSDWNNSAVFQTSLHGQDISIYVTTNSSYLFIGFNVTTQNFLPVNDTIPDFNSSVEVYDLGYNNQTHDWFAIILDNNLDKVSTTTSFGTKDSPDDVVVFDQYNSTAYDGYADGNTTQYFSPDMTTLYNATVNDPGNLNINGTLLQGNSGTDDVTAARNSTLVIDPNPEGIDKTHVFYEMAKPLDGTDTNGHDFSLAESKILQFKLLAWNNQKSNDSLTNAAQSNWYSLKMNETGNGFAYKTPGNTTINLIQDWTDPTKFDGLSTVLSLYGFDVKTPTFTNTTLQTADTNIIILDQNSDITSDDLTNIIQYVRNGGSVMIFLSSSDTESSSTLADAFEMSFLPNDVIFPVDSENTTNTIHVQKFDTSISSISGDASSTSLPINEVNLSSGALNISQVMDKSNKFIQGQGFFAYNLFDAPNGTVYDSTADGYINSTETFDGLSLGVAFDLVEGGRFAIFPSDTLISDTNIVSSDNIPFLLRMLPWVSKTTQTIIVHDISVDKVKLDQSSSITITVNATDGFNNTLPNDVKIIVDLYRAGNLENSYELTKNNEGLYTRTIKIDYRGYVDIETTANLAGYGFAEATNLQVFVKPTPILPNDLSKISLVLVGLFAISVATTILVYLRTIGKSKASKELKKKN